MLEQDYGGFLYQAKEFLGHNPVSNVVSEAYILLVCTIF